MPPEPTWFTGRDAVAAFSSSPRSRSPRQCHDIGSCPPGPTARSPSVSTAGGRSRTRSCVTRSPCCPYVSWRSNRSRSSEAQRHLSGSTCPSPSRADHQPHPRDKTASAPRHNTTPIRSTPSAAKRAASKAGGTLRRPRWRGGSAPLCNGKPDRRGATLARANAAPRSLASSNQLDTRATPWSRRPSQLLSRSARRSGRPTPSSGRAAQLGRATADLAPPVRLAGRWI